MKKLRLWFLIFIGAISLLWAISVQASSEDLSTNAYSEVNSFAQNEDTVDPDVAAYMNFANVSRAEAERRLGNEERISQLRQELDSVDGFGGLYIEHEPTYSIVINYTPQLNLEALLTSYVSLLPEIDTKIVNYPLSDLRSARQALIHNLPANYVNTFEMEIDISANQLKVYTLDEYREDLSSEIYALSVFEAIDTDILSISTIPELSRPVNDGKIYGGDDLNFSDGTLHCTSGFGAVYNGQDGILTAYHCVDNEQNYHEGIQLGSTPIYHASQDWAFTYTPGLAVTSGVKVDDGVIAITGWKSRNDMSNGDWVCKEGETTGFDCGTISNTCYVVNGNCFVQARTNVDQGDSGGAAFRTGDAYGIVTHESGFFHNRVLFTPLDHVIGQGYATLK